MDNYSKLYWIQQYSVNLIKPRNDTQCIFTLGPDHLLLLINLCINHALPEGICSERKPSLFGILKLIYFSAFLKIEIVKKFTNLDPNLA